MTTRKPAHLLQKSGRKPMPKEQHRAWTLIELRARCFITLKECWEWRTAQRQIPPTEHGRRYPQVAHRGENETVRRLAWQLATGRELEAHLKVAPTKCRNPRCQNPWHNQPMTESERQLLAASEGSFSTPERRRAVAEGRRKSLLAGTKLDWEKVKRIRAIEGAADKHCAEFDISASMFNRVRSGKNWKEAF